MLVWSFDLAGSQPAILLTITRVDGAVRRITTAASPITLGGDTWVPQGGLKMGVLTERADGTLPSLGFNIQLALSGSNLITLSDVHKKKYKGAEVRVELTNAANPTVADFIAIGLLKGNITYQSSGIAGFEVISKFAVPRDIFIRTYQLLCDADFGDPIRCKIPTFPYSLGRWLQDVERNETIAVGDVRRYRFGSANTPEDYNNVYIEATAITTGVTSGSLPSFSSTVGATTTDGGVTWTTRNAWVRAVQIASAPDQRTLVLDRMPDPRADGDNTWYQPGSILFANGDHMLRRFRVGSWDSATLTIQTYLPCNLAAVGDFAEIAPDCDHTIEMCSTKYGNALNFRGFTNQQGAKAQAMQLGY